MILQTVTPITDIRATKEYRLQMCQVMFERGIKAAVGRLAGNGLIRRTIDLKSRWSYGYETDYNFNLNGSKISLEVAPYETLLEMLRDRLGVKTLSADVIAVIVAPAQSCSMAARAELSHPGCEIDAGR